MLKITIIACLWATFVLGQIARFPVTKDVEILGNDLFVGLTVSLWVIYCLVKKRPFSSPSLIKPVFLFGLVCFISLTANAGNLTLKEFLVSGLYLLRFIFYAGMYFLVYQKIKDGALKKTDVIRLLFLAGMGITVLGIFQYFFYPNFWPLEPAGWDPHEFRVAGTFLDPNFTVVILIFTILLSFQLLKNKRLIVSSFFLLFAFLFTYSRSGYLMYAVSVLTLSFLRRSKRVLLLLFVLLTVFFLPRPPGLGTKLERTLTLETRIESWKEAVVVFNRNPVFGVGFNSYRYARQKMGFLVEKDGETIRGGAGADSSLLFLAATTGAVGLVGYLWLLSSLLKIAAKNRNHILSAVFLSSLAGVFIHSFFNNTLFYPFIMEWVWILAAVTEVENENKKK